MKIKQYRVTRTLILEGDLGWISRTLDAGFIKPEKPFMLPNGNTITESTQLWETLEEVELTENL